MPTPFETFASDSNRIECYLWEFRPYDPATSAERLLYYSTQESDASVSGYQFVACITEGWNFEADASPVGTLGLLPPRKGGEVRLGNQMGALDGLSSLYWDGRRCECRLGGYSPMLGRQLTWAEADVRMVGETDRLDPGLDEVVIAVRSPEDRFEHPIEDVVYTGSSWVLHFATGDVVTFGSPAKLNLTGDVTIIARVRPTTFAATNQLISWNNSATVFPFLLRVTTAGALFYNNSSITGATATAGTIPLDTWSTVSVTVSGATAVFRAWREDTGALLFEETQTLSSATRVAGDGNLRIGENGGATSPGFQLDWLDIYSAVKSKEWIESRRTRQLSTADLAASDLVFHGCDDGTGTTFTDSSASPANGTISGADWLPSLEGGEGLAGKIKPNAFGPHEWSPAVLVFEPTRIYQHHARKAGTFTSAEEGGAALTTGTNYTDLLAFLQASTTAGAVDACQTDGGSYFRLGSSPLLPVTWTGQGDASGSGYVSTAADIVRRIVATRGPAPLTDPTDLDTAAFTQLNSDNSEPVKLWLDRSTKISEALRLALVSVGAVGWTKRASGLFTVKRFAGVSGTAVLALDERDIANIVPHSGFEHPAWRVELDFRRIPAPMSIEQLAVATVGAFRQILLGSEYRTATRDDATTRRDHPRARTLGYVTALTTKAATLAEAQRVLDIMKGSGRPWTITLRRPIVALDRMDVVTVAINDLDRFGADLARLGFGAGRSMVVLGYVETESSNSAVLTAWG